jgi:argininosuccinate lyase
MKTLWDKGKQVDAEIGDFTVGDDREVDAHLACQDVFVNLAHVRVLHDAGLLDDEDTAALTAHLRQLHGEALSGALRPGPEDEDIHSCLERRLTEALGDAGRRVHTARSRNDQVATDVALWLREQAIAAHEEVLEASLSASRFAKDHSEAILPGMTHLQPAMPSTFGQWAAGFSSLLLDDAAQLRSAFESADACPLGSAAGYGIPTELAPIDRDLSARLLGFSRSLRPVTAVQGGRGKPEAALLMALSQVATTCARLAQDVVLYCHPSFGYLKLPDGFTTGSSIMPQKRNPDVMELVRGKAKVVHAALFEVINLSSSLGSGYHRDFQLLKGPLIRGVMAARSMVRMVAYVLPGVEVKSQKAERDCDPPIYATHRALELVVAGTPFRTAYQQVARELSMGTLPAAQDRPVPSIEAALHQIVSRHENEVRLVGHLKGRVNEAYANLLEAEVLP